MSRAQAPLKRLGTTASLTLLLFCFELFLGLAMKFLLDNCIQEMKAPLGQKINQFAYSSELNLIASMEYCEDCLLWNPDNGQVVNEIELDHDCHSDIIFLPGHYIAVAFSDAPQRGSRVCIHSVDSGENILDVSAGFCEFEVVALTPDNRLLVGGRLTDFLIDLDNKQIVEERRIVDSSFRSWSLCCSKQNYNTIFFTSADKNRELELGFCILTVDFSTDGKVLNTSLEEVTYCLIEGEERDLSIITGLSHDGEHVIVATEREGIILLESACEGSVGHVIVSSGIPSDEVCYPLGQQMVTHQNQLMVSDGGDVIKVYNYKRYDSLQELCRLRINHFLQGNKEKVDKLPLPSTVKNYLLYK
ncbi:uncharacterized protein LOC110247591 [Exaiptasia diaphana]|uniref:SOCS box domain-containing protein n=1 Tax=Exaiptasia diaphana TaxID=2652724 RepID=A0A913XTY6_EXADI|nr:uncharacterized protein LOC110247591 [Exaiptasia diaphana]